MANLIRRFDKIVGCMYGGAIGDALGYPIEFHSYDAITSRYGDTGVQEFILDKNSNLAIISDDTQMTLFTANGLLNCEAYTDILKTVEDWTHYVGIAYRYWLNTQEKPYSSRKGEYNRSDCWIYDRSELWHDRAPGNTCLSSLHKKELGSIANRINDSKGCGGVMRVAPVGLLLPKYNYEYGYIFKVGAEIAALTHGNIDGWAPAGMLSVLIARIVYEDETFIDSLKYSMRLTKELLKQYSKDASLLIAKVNQAYNLAINSFKVEEDEPNIRTIGGGWTGEEALAIAIYCAVKYEGLFEDAVRASVNHSGDSDSTGAITGNIVGALLGESHIQESFKDRLECKDIIEQLSVDMFTDIDKHTSKYGVLN